MLTYAYARVKLRRVHRYTAIPSVPDFPGAVAVCSVARVDGISALRIIV